MSIDYFKMAQDICRPRPKMMEATSVSEIALALPQKITSADILVALHRAFQLGLDAKGDYCTHSLPVDDDCAACNAEIDESFKRALRLV